MALKKQKRAGKKIFNYGQISRNIESKHYTKHVLYCMLYCRFNAIQRFADAIK